MSQVQPSLSRDQWPLGDSAQRLAIDWTNVSNAGSILSEAARICPNVIAVAEAPRGRSSGRASYRQMTFQQLDRWATEIAAGLLASGVPQKKETRLALMVPPGIDFVALVSGIFRAGLICVLIDPGMGKRNLVRCLGEADLDGVIGVAKAHWLKLAFPAKFRRARFNFSVNGRWPGAPPIAAFRGRDVSDFRPPPVDREDAAACIFTTGSTGPPKGVLYRHRHFIHQAIDISGYFRLQPGSVDVSGFPLFALFNAAIGATTVFPRMNFTRPAKVNPRNIVAAVEDWSATQSFGSPALWNNVAGYCVKRRMQLPTLRNIMTAGAPVPVHVLTKCQAIIGSEGEVHTPYGATEALPVACITASEVLGETAAHSRLGRGTCVGRRFPEVDWQVIAIDDGPISEIARAKALPAGEIGELIVRGPVVTDRYLTRTEANALHKISDGNTVWHRMGDVGYLDRQDRFWFCGRKSHRVQTAGGTMFTIPCEAIVNQHPAIYRSALVGVGRPGRQRPAIVAEPWPEHWPRRSLARMRLLDELRELIRANELTRAIEHVFLLRSLPVDIRHNSKIFREKLAIWVARRVPDRG